MATDLFPLTFFLRVDLNLSLDAAEGQGYLLMATDLFLKG